MSIFRSEDFSTLCSKATRPTTYEEVHAAVGKIIENLNVRYGAKPIAASEEPSPVSSAGSCSGDNGTEALSVIQSAPEFQSAE